MAAREALLFEGVNENLYVNSVLLCMPHKETQRIAV